MSEELPIWEGTGSGRREVAVPKTDGSHRFLVDLPMETDMEQEFSALPWEANGETVPLDPPSTVSSVGNDVSIVAPASQARAARRYIQGVASRLPEETREAVVRGAGLFDFPVPDDDDLNGLLGA
jgi:hypothetical protein